MKNLNLVLLGLPSSGKSALLAALQQAAQKQGTDIDGSLVDLTGELAKLRLTAPGEKYRPTEDAVTAYPVKRRVNGRDETATLHDTSGAKAVGILTGKENVAGRGPLPSVLAEADGVLLVVDAASGPADLKAQFAEFLDKWQTQRSQATAVGGLPLFIVLAKCDKLARAGETHEQWRRHVKDAVGRVDQQFKKALEDSRDLSFGRIDICVRGASVKPPASEKSGANEPYQVKKLFDDVFRAAEAYRQRSERSSQTLQGALVGLGGVAALLLLVVGWYFATQPTLDEAALENKVKTLLASGDASRAEHVREPVEDRLKELREVKAHPAYAQLPAAVREQIKAAEEAIEAYQRINREFQETVRNPRLVTRVSDLTDIDKTLAGFDDKIKDWPETRLAKRHQEWSAEAAALHQAVKDEEAWTRAQIQEGEKLRAAGGLVIAKQADAAAREAWFKAVHDFQVRNRRHKSNDRVEGTTIPYRVVYQFDRVEAAERDLRQFKDRLEKLREEALEK
jgi:GTPase SAR1 family protein